MEDIKLPVVIDSPVFVSAFGKPDVYSRISSQLFATVTSRVLVIIPVIVVAETIVTLYRQNAASGKKMFLYFTSVHPNPINIEFVEQTLDFLPGNTLKTADFLIAATAALHKAILITWDKQLLSSANKICKTVTPTQFISQSKT